MLNPKFEYRNSKQTSVKPMSGSRRRFGNPSYQNSNDRNNESEIVGDNSHFFENLDFEHLILFRISDFVLRILTEKSDFTLLSCAVTLTKWYN